MKIMKPIWVLGLMFTLASLSVNGGPRDPDCTAEKAAKSTAMKATVGVGGRCSPAEAAKDTTKGKAKDVADIEDKGALEKRRDDDGLAKKTVKKVGN